MTLDINELCHRARLASYLLAGTDTATKNKIIEAMADALERGTEAILAANKIDVENYKKGDTTFLDRLTLDKKRVADMVEGVRQVARLADPVGEVTEAWTAKSGLKIKKVRAPLGVVGVIYEARPNVTADVAALCLKSGNAVVLRGGSDAIHSNRKIYELMSGVVSVKNAICFIDDTERASVLELIKQNAHVDVIIPRGGDGLKNFILEHATMPVIASSGGNCHIYVDEAADLAKAERIILNAKLQRPSVCNAVEHLVVHSAVAERFVPEIIKKLHTAGVFIIGCERTEQICACDKLANELDFKTEFEKLILTIKIVDDSDTAILIINENSTKHSEAIVTENQEIAAKFSREVDSGAVYINASTRFTDGFEFGFGAEIGISTQKLHARGPIGLLELTSAKYVCEGNGLIRE